MLAARTFTRLGILWITVEFRLTLAGDLCVHGKEPVSRFASAGSAGALRLDPGSSEPSHPPILAERAIRVPRSLVISAAGAAMTGAAATDVPMPPAAAATSSTGPAAPDGRNPGYNGVPMTVMFNNMCAAAGLENDFMAWMVNQDIRDEETWACAADTQADVRELVKTAKAAGVKFATVGKEACVMKLWHACRKATSGDDGKQTTAPPADKDAPIPPEVELGMKREWDRRHSFVIPTSSVLVASLQGKIYRGLLEDPPRLEITLVEALRPMSCTDKALGTMLAVVPGRSIEPVTVVADTVLRPFDVYLRVRAWFFTLAFISVKRPQWFDLQDAWYASERILYFVLSQYNGITPPTNYFVTAWALTVNHFADAIRTQEGTTLKSLVYNAGAWEHRWTNFVPTEKANQRQAAQTRGGADAPDHIKQQMDKMKQTIRSLQGEVDREKVRNTRLRHADSGNGGQSSGGQERRRSRSPSRRGGGGRGKGGGKASKQAAQKRTSGGKDEYRRR